MPGGTARPRNVRAQSRELVAHASELADDRRATDGELRGSVALRTEAHELVLNLGKPALQVAL